MRSSHSDILYQLQRLGIVFSSWCYGITGAVNKNNINQKFWTRLIRVMVCGLRMNLVDLSRDLSGYERVAFKFSTAGCGYIYLNVLHNCTTWTCGTFSCPWIVFHQSNFILSSKTSLHQVSFTYKQSAFYRVFEPHYPTSLRRIHTELNATDSKFSTLFSRVLTFSMAKSLLATLDLIPSRVNSGSNCQIGNNQGAIF